MPSILCLSEILLLENMYINADTDFTTIAPSNTNCAMVIYNDDETDYGMSIDFHSGFSLGVIDSTRDDSDPFLVITYSLNG